MILLAEHDEPSLAAKKKQQHVALKTAASTSKNRVWNFFGSPLGQIRSESDLSAENATGSVQFSYETASGQAYYYTRDHLGSVRELCSSTGTITSRMAYDPYGRVTVVSGTTLPTFQYAGLYAHGPSGLGLPDFRGGYDANLGKFIQRDFIGERGGLNLYEYARNLPVSLTDFTGFAPTFDITIHRGSFSNPWVDVHISDPCCKNIHMKQWVKENYWPSWKPDGGMGNGDYPSLQDPGGSGVTSNGDSPGFGPDDGTNGKGFWPRVNREISNATLGALIQEFVVCAVCEDKNGSNPKVLGCVHFFTVNNAFGGYGIGGGTGLPSDPNVHPPGGF